MVKLFPLFLFLLILKISSQDTQKTNPSDSSFTFQVFDVEETTKRPTDFMSAKDVILERVQPKAKIEDFSHKKDPDTKFLSSDMNGFMSAIHWSYTQHYPLKLSVSDFILMIGQGLAKHMENHAEDLREQFVDHKGKELIEVKRADLIPGREDNDWSTVFGQFTDEIKKRVKTDLYDVIIDDTSVATKLSRISSEITIMDAFKQYFEYQVTFICGIPRITLVGSKDDWEKLRSKVAKLKELNKDNRLLLDWWLEKLAPVVDQIVDQATSQKVDKAFWQNIYKWQIPEKGYDPQPFITGWINVFNPYLVQRNGKVFQSTFDKISPKVLISGFSRVPFVWAIGEEKIPMNFFGGFLGAKMAKEDNTVEPVYFYAVTYDQEASKGEEF